MNLKRILTYGISLFLAVGLLWLVFKDIDLSQLAETIKKADYRWVFVSACMTLLAHWSRAYRWKLMLQPLGYNPSAFKSTIAVLIGYLTNLVLPRAGEFARSASLKDLENVPFEKSFGAVVAERVIDLLVLALLIALNLLLEFDRLFAFFKDFFAEKTGALKILSILAIVGLVVLVIGFRYLRKNDEKLQKIALYAKIREVVLGLWSGFTGIFALKNPWAFIGHTIFIWTMYYGMTYALCIALPQTASLGPVAVLTILVMGTIGMAAPTIGGIGSYHYLVGNIVSLYGLDQQDGITLATFLHAGPGLIFIIIFGLSALLISFFIRKNSHSSAV